MNLRPSGYEPDELPNCSTPRYKVFFSRTLYVLYYTLYRMSTVFLKIFQKNFTYFEFESESRCFSVWERFLPYKMITTAAKVPAPTKIPIPYAMYGLLLL